MKYLLSFCLLMLSLKVQAQINLVPNPSFEDTVSCPHFANQIDKAAGWWASRESPDYFNECDWLTGNTSVPQNFCGYQYAFHGSAYAGFVAFARNFPNAREYFTCQLINPLTTGKKYFVRYYLNLSGGGSKKIACNNIGLLFSTVNYNLSNPAFVGNHSQFKTDSIIADTLNWVLVDGSFIADSNYTYLSVGNFYDDMLTDTINIIPSPSTYSYYFIDSISVVEDPTLSIFGAQNHDFIIYPNPFSESIRLHSRDNKIETFHVIDMSGQTIKIITDIISESAIYLNFESMSKGIYILIINNSSYHKIIKL
ncbi:MAG: T9SS type A sorting domain-containing protein [Bacteroidia bacterium]|nr:T9SS type A sorting domain-containing protein [Bacteroidia bacterium]